MQTLIEYFNGLPKDRLVCVTPLQKITCGELVSSANRLREQASLLSNPLIVGGDLVSALSLMLALDGFASALFLLPADIPDVVRNKVREHANQQRRLLSCDQTQWIMATSGTTGTPKLVSHTLRSLTRAVKRQPQVGERFSWGLLYDPCRFAGLQVVLQAMLGGSVLLVPGAVDDVESCMAFFAEQGCTSLSATPSMWRKLLSATTIDHLNLRQITLGGEIVDEKTLQRLRQLFPQAKITHIYASTEAGAGFSVKDGKAGFPLSYLDEVPGANIQLKISPQGTLCVRGIREQDFDQAYFDQPDMDQSQTLKDSQGFIDTGDLVEIRDQRIFFLGRVNGSINVGGRKVMPEEVENILRSSAEVLDVRVYAKPSPVLGAIVVADILPKPGSDGVQLKKQLKQLCQEHLEAFKRPALMQLVTDIQLTATGKIKRGSS